MVTQTGPGVSLPRHPRDRLRRLAAFCGVAQDLGPGAALTWGGARLQRLTLDLSTNGLGSPEIMALFAEHVLPRWLVQLDLDLSGSSVDDSLAENLACELWSLQVDQASF